MFIKWTVGILATLFLLITYASALGIIWYASPDYYETHYWLTVSIRVFCSSILSMFLTFMYGNLLLALSHE